MNPLQRFEQLVEGIMEGSFSRLFGGKLQPVEIAKRAARAMESHQRVGANGKIYVPNNFQVYLNQNDYALYEQARASLERELANYLIGTAHEQNLFFLTPPQVSVAAAKDVGPSHVRVDANYVDRPQSPGPNPAPANMGQTVRIGDPQPAVPQNRSRNRTGVPQALIIDEPSLPANGERFPLDLSRQKISIGRSLDNDIVIEDGRVSRRHAELERRGNQILLRDIQSTNGTLLNGQPVQETTLSPGDRVSLGGLELVVE